jgi:hypothetical protein
MWLVSRDPITANDAHAGGTGLETQRAADDEVGRLRCAIKHLEAREVLTENGELKGVHSTASVRSMLNKLEAA